MILQCRAKAFAGRWRGNLDAQQLQRQHDAVMQHDTTNQQVPGDLLGGERLDDKDCLSRIAQATMTKCTEFRRLLVSQSCLPILKLLGEVTEMLAQRRSGHQPVELRHLQPEGKAGSLTLTPKPFNLFDRNQARPDPSRYIAFNTYTRSLKIKKESRSQNQNRSPIIKSMAIV